MPGDIALLDPDVRQVAGAPGGGADRGLGDVVRQERVAAPGEHLGEHADGAPGLEGPAVPGGQEPARLIAYLRCSYQRSSKPHGSATPAYMASK